MEIMLCYVVSVFDDDGTGRINIEVRNVVNEFTHDRKAIPLLPKILHVRPKIGEMVVVFDSGNTNLWYIGPVVSQLQDIYKCDFEVAKRGLNSTKNRLLRPPLKNIPDSKGTYPNEEDVSLYGRKNTEIILSDNETMIRSGVRTTNKSNNKEFIFNRTNPSFFKLKYHEDPITCYNVNPITNNRSEKTVGSTATLVAQEINLISTEGTPYFDVADRENNMISDEIMSKIISEAHCLPYGDTLVKFLNLFIHVFLNHVHGYHNLPTVRSHEVKNLENFDLNSLLSKNVRIN